MGGGCDTSQKLEIIHIEPYPKLLQSLLNENDVKNLNLYAMRLQDVPLSVFDELYENDILFVDSTHISK